MPAGLWLLVAAALGGAAPAELTPPPPQLQPPRPAPGAAPIALPPPGEARTAVTGCAAAADEVEARRHPAPVTRGGAPPRPAVEVVPGGAVVTHPLTHACCLRATITVRTEADTAVVGERLTGTPCRCMCGSTVRAALGLGPGAWTVAVEVEEGGKTRRVLEERVNIPPR